MSEFANWGEYSQLLRRIENGEILEGNDATLFDTYQKQFDTFKEESKIKFEIEGLQALEQAGDLLDGTAAKIEKLQKGGTFAIEAMVDIKTDVHKQAQLDALLSSSNEKDIAQAVMQLTSATEAEYYQSAKSKEALKKLAESYRKQQREKEIASYNEYRATLSEADKATYDAYMLQNGYEFVSEEYVVPEGYKVLNNKVYNDKTGEEYIGGTEALRRAGSYRYKGATNVDNIAPHVTAEQKYTSAQINMMARRILNGEEVSNEERDLYNAAESQYEWLKEYRRGGMIDETAKLYAEQEILAGERGELAERLRNEYAGNKDVDTIVQTATTMAYGTTKEKASLTAQYENQLREFANAQYVLNNGELNESTIQLISSITGDAEDYIRDAFKKGNKDEFISKMSSILGEGIQPWLQGLGVQLESVVDKSSLLSAMKSANIDESIVSVFDALVESIENVGGQIRIQSSEVQTKDLAQLYDEIDYKSPTYKTRAAAWMSTNLSDILNISKDVVFGENDGDFWTKGIGEAIKQRAAETGVSSEVISTLYDAEFKSLMEAYGHNMLSDDLLSQYFDNMSIGSKNKALFYESFRKDFLKDYVDENGNIKAESITELQEFLRNGQGDEDRAAAIGLLTTKYSEFIDLIATTDSTKLEELRIKINELFGEEIVDEMLEFSKASKDTKEALKEIMYGNEAVGIARINEDFTDTATNLYSLKKLRNKNGDYREGKKYTAAQRKQLAAAMGGGATADTVYGMSNAEIKTAIEYSNNEDFKQKGLNLAAELQALSTKYGALDLNKIKFNKDNTIDISEAVKGMSPEAVNAYETFFRGPNQNIKDKIWAYNWGNIFDSAGYSVVPTKEEAMSKYGREDDFKTAVRTMEYLNREGQALDFKSDFTLDSTNIPAQYKDAIDKLNKIQEKNPAIIKASIGVVNSNGQVATVNGQGTSALQDGFNNFINQWQEVTGSKYTELTKEQQDNMGAMYVLNNGNKTGKPTGRGGGGGTPAWQKALQDAEYRAKVSEHEIKMAQLRQEYYGNRNNYSKQIAQIKAEEKAYKNYEKELKSTISSLEAERSNVAYGTQEYYKLTEAIENYTEKLQQAKNARDRLIEKNMAVLSEQQEWTDTKHQHKQSMTEIYLDRAKTLYQNGSSITTNEAFAQYLARSAERRSGLIEQRNTNDEQLKEWQKMLKKARKNSDQYREIRKKIMEIQEENAQIENTLLDQEIEENEMKLAKIASDLENNVRQFENITTIAELNAKRYSQNKNYAAYRGELSRQSEGYKSQYAYYENAITQAIIQRTNYAEGSAAWNEADKQVMSLSQAFIKLQATIEDIDRAMAESYLAEIQDKYAFSNALLGSKFNEASNLTKLYESLGADSLVIKSLGIQKGYLGSQLADKINEYNDIDASIKAGNYSKYAPTKEEAETKKASVEAEIQGLKTDIVAMQLQEDRAKITRRKNLYESKTLTTENQIELTRYDETKFKNNGQLTNYGKALANEKSMTQYLLRETESEIKEAEALYTTFDPASPQAKELMTYIQELRKKQKEYTNSIEETDKALEQNQEEIRKTYQAYENAIEAAIEAQKQKEKDILGATVSLQDTLLDSIKNRYRKEWELLKEDIDKKKEAWNEEKAILRERMNAKHEAENVEDIESRIAELQKQLALIEGDSTQTKQAKEIRAKIKELTRQRTNIQDERLVSAEETRIDKLIKAYDDFVEDEDKRVNELLENDNNFTDTINKILSGDFEGFMAEILKDKDYLNKTPEAIEQIRQGFSDTWDKMTDYIRTNWDDVKAIADSMTEDEFVEYMKSTDDYRKASDSGKKSLEFGWREVYRNKENAKIDTYKPTEYEKETPTLSNATEQTLVSRLGKTFDSLGTSLSQLPSGWAKNVFDSIGNLSSDVGNISYRVGLITKDREDQEKANNVIKLIQALGDNVSLDAGFKAKLDAANAGFAELTDEQKQYVGGNADTLTRANTNYNRMAEGVSQASSVINAINGIGTVTLSDDVASRISSARTAYDSLSDNARQYVTNLGTLTSAEATYNDLKTKFNTDINKLYEDTKELLKKRKQAGAITDAEYEERKTKYEGYKNSGDVASLADKYYHNYYKYWVEKEWKDNKKETATSGHTQVHINLDDYPSIGTQIKNALNGKENISIKNASKYLYGGLVDYTGPAWVDGTKTKPEAFLDYIDTKNIRDLADSLRYVTPYLGVLPTSEMMGYGNNTNIGNINITINQAELKEDADYDEVARKVGKAFTKELQKNGFNLASYAF